MKIDFTIQQYRALIDMISIAEWILFSHEEGGEPKDSEYSMLVQKIYSHAEEMQCADTVSRSQCPDEFHIDDNYFYNIINPLIDHYDNEMFWGELTDRLSSRDTCREKTVESLDQVDLVERVTLVGKHEGKWNEEFITHGIKRLTIRDE